jgi:hypothetical protein
MLRLSLDHAARVCRFRDSRDREWRVFERRREAFGGAVTLLVFDCDSLFRCVRRYPANWYELLPDALERLSWQS